MLYHKTASSVCKNKKRLHPKRKTILMTIMLMLAVSNTIIAQVKLGQLSPEYTKVLGITVGYPSFQTIIARFGRAKEFKQQRECCKDVYLCYKSKASKNALAVVFGGTSGDNTVESVYVSQYDALADILSYAPGELKTDFLKNYCVESDKIPDNISIGNLVFGTTKEQLYKVWGKPSYSHNNIVTYEYYADGNINEKLISLFKKQSYVNLDIKKFPYVTISSRIKILFKDNKLVGFGIHRSFVLSGQKFYPNESAPLKP